MHSNPFQDNPEMAEYFATLPAFVQETIMQAGVKPSSIEDLRGCAENLKNGSQG